MPSTSSAEEYFRATYIGLLRHSPRKAAVLRTVRGLTGDDLARISDGRATVEGTVAQYMGFQTLDRVHAAFRDVDAGLDIGAPLKRPYHNRRKPLYESVSDLFERRHNFIHRMRLDPRYGLDSLKRDSTDLAAGIERIYGYLVAAYGWSEYDK